jgi:hypothetical protein
LTVANRKEPASDGTVPPQDAPPIDEKAVPVEEDISNLPGAIQAVRPVEPVEELESDADYVEYKGRATERRITADQWLQARVKDQSEIVWDASNEFKVPLDDLNEAAIAALRRDGAFAIPEGK